jgi:hypothetical protein
MCFSDCWYHFFIHKKTENIEVKRKVKTTVNKVKKQRRKIKEQKTKSKKKKEKYKTKNVKTSANKCEN